MSEQQFKVGDTVKLRYGHGNENYTVSKAVTTYKLGSSSLSWAADELVLVEPPITKDDVNKFVDDYYSNLYITTKDVLLAFYKAVKERGIE